MKQLLTILFVTSSVSLIAYARADSVNSSHSSTSFSCPPPGKANASNTECSYTFSTPGEYSVPVLSWANNIIISAAGGGGGGDGSAGGSGSGSGGGGAAGGSYYTNMGIISGYPTCKAGGEVGASGQDGGDVYISDVYTINILSISGGMIYARQK